MFSRRFCAERKKGPDYQGNSSCILIGHSFGGLVMETAVTPLLRNQLAKLEAGGQTKPYGRPDRADQ